MNTPPEAEIFLVRAQESLAGAESEFANGRYNNCANRCYYDCFQAAIAALLRAGVHPRNPRAEWDHAFVQAQFVVRLIDRRKEYPGSLRDLLSRLLSLRQTGDYRTEEVSKIQAERAARRARDFVLAIQGNVGRGR